MDDDLTTPHTTDRPAKLEDFYALMPNHRYLYVPTHGLWPAESVNARVPKVPVRDHNGTPLYTAKGAPLAIPASHWLDDHRPLDTVTWAPGEAEVIRDKVPKEGGWREKPGAAVFNYYWPPLPLSPDANADDVDPWLRHLEHLYPLQAERDHIQFWLAHRLQKPHQKLNHALVMGGGQGIGKDTLLEPVKRGIGPWNWQDITPRHVTDSRFNGFAKSVIVRINELRDLGDANRFQFYDQMKSYICAPPDVLRVDEKFQPEYYVLNVCAVLYTTNYLTDGMYLPEDDRRHFFAWSHRKKDDAVFGGGYWQRLWGWYASGGIENVVAYLTGLDLSAFDPAAPPPKTDAFYEVVMANRAPEEAEMRDTLDVIAKEDRSYDRPHGVTLALLGKHAISDDFRAWLHDRKNRRALHHRLEACGYSQVRNPERPNDGLWRIRERRVAIYAPQDASPEERIRAAKRIENE
jgi:Family of unknown function (DUF5906)